LARLVLQELLIPILQVTTMTTGPVVAVVAQVAQAHFLHQPELQLHHLRITQMQQRVAEMVEMESQSRGFQPLSPRLCQLGRHLPVLSSSPVVAEEESVLTV
jgi:hypothetical protein